MTVEGGSRPAAQATVSKPRQVQQEILPDELRIVHLERDTTVNTVPVYNSREAPDTACCALTTA